METTRLRAVAGAALLTVALGALGGCGVAGTDFQPGAAAVVGDRTVSADEVDDLTLAACDALQEQLAGQNRVVPLSLLRGTIVQNMTLADATRQMGEEYGVGPSSRYARQQAATRSSTGDLPEEQLRAVQVLQDDPFLVEDVVGQVGFELLSRDAGPGADVPGPTSDEAVARGSDALKAWIGENRVELDPRYGLSVDAEDGVTDVDTSVSFAVSDDATQGANTQPDPAQVMQLPASQRCGAYTGPA